MIDRTPELCVRQRAFVLLGAVDEREDGAASEIGLHARAEARDVARDDSGVPPRSRCLPEAF